jgi:hypothetical protein
MYTCIWLKTNHVYRHSRSCMRPLLERCALQINYERLRTAANSTTVWLLGLDTCGVEYHCCLIAPINSCVKRRSRNKKADVPLIAVAHGHGCKQSPTMALPCVEQQTHPYNSLAGMVAGAGEWRKPQKATGPIHALCLPVNYKQTSGRHGNGQPEVFGEI